MSIWSMLLFILAIFYLVGGFLEFPIMFEGNPKTRLLISKMGKNNFKILLYVLAVVFMVLAFLLK